MQNWMTTGPKRVRRRKRGSTRLLLARMQQRQRRTERRSRSEGGPVVATSSGPAFVMLSHCRVGLLESCCLVRRALLAVPEGAVVLLRSGCVLQQEQYLPTGEELRWNQMQGRTCRLSW